MGKVVVEDIQKARKTSRKLENFVEASKPNCTLKTKLYLKI